MGCDGGTIPKRDELVRKKKKKEKKDKQAEMNFRWLCCSISQAHLQKPIVACGLGKLYNKDSVITGLLDRTTLPESAQHIKSLKDIRELNLSPNPSFKPNQDNKGDSYVDYQNSPFICPLVGVEMNGTFKFCFSWSCGCVISERAMKELKSKTCQQCQHEIEESEIVILNAIDDDLDLMKTRMECRQARAKAEKKAKKAIKLDIKATIVETSTPSTSTSAQLNDNKAVKAGKRLGDSTSLGMQHPDLKKTKQDYSVSKDPQASDVYKSLFTTSNKAKNQMKAHWVTFNPFYN